MREYVEGNRVMRNGPKTTEFWIAVITIAINALAYFGVLEPSSAPAEVEASLWPSGIAAAGYAIARGIAKA